MSEPSTRPDSIPGNWTLATVGEVGDVQLGRQRSPKHLTGRFSTPYVRAANITSNGLDVDDVLEMDFTEAERDAYALAPGDILLAEASGSPEHVGRACIWNGELDLCCFQNTVLRFRARSLSPAYALVAFRDMAESGVLARTARGVGIQHLGAKRFAAIRMAVPPLAEQDRIVAELAERERELDQAEAALQDARRKCNEQRQGILRSVIDRVPGHGDTWPEIRIGDAGQVDLGKMRQPSQHSGTHMRSYLRVANVREAAIDFDDLHEMNFTPEEMPRYRLAPGDILLNEGQSPELVGRPAMYRGEIPELYFQKTLLRFRAGPTVDAEYALLVFRNYLHRGVFRAQARASTNIAHLTQRRFIEMPFPLPPMDVQRDVAGAVSAALEQVDAQATTIDRSIRGLMEVRRGMLRAAVNGQLVAQDERDSPVELSARDAPEPATRRTRPRTRKAETAGRTAPTEGPPLRLDAVIGDANEAMSIPELFRAAGLNPDDTDDVEAFYLLLRSADGVTVTKAGIDVENARFKRTSS